MAFTIALIAAGIVAVGVSVGTYTYHRYKSMYMARLTAENVYHLVSASEDVPAKMNGFSIFYTLDGTVLTVKVGSWDFEFEVGK